MLLASPFHSQSDAKFEKSYTHTHTKKNLSRFRFFLKGTGSLPGEFSFTVPKSISVFVVADEQPRLPLWWQRVKTFHCGSAGGRVNVKLTPVTPGPTKATFVSALTLYSSLRDILTSHTGTFSHGCQPGIQICHLLRAPHTETLRKSAFVDVTVICQAHIFH